MDMISFSFTINAQVVMYIEFAIQASADGILLIPIFNCSKCGHLLAMLVLVPFAAFLELCYYGLYLFQG